MYKDVLVESPLGLVVETTNGTDSVLPLLLRFPLFHESIFQQAPRETFVWPRARSIRCDYGIGRFPIEVGVCGTSKMVTKSLNFGSTDRAPV